LSRKKSRDLGGVIDFMIHHEIIVKIFSRHNLLVCLEKNVAKLLACHGHTFLTELKYGNRVYIKTDL